MRRRQTLRTWTAIIVSATTARAVVAATSPTPQTTAAAEPVQTHGTLEAVTVYRNQALVTRRVRVDGPAGLREVVVTKLPPQVVSGSLYAEPGRGLTVRSVRYRTRAVEADVRERVAKLDKQIRQVKDQVKQDERAMKVINQQQDYLDKLEKFTAATADTELTRGVLNADTLTTLTNFQFNKRQELARRELKGEFVKRQLSDQLDLLKRKKTKLTGSSTKTAREAVVFVDLQKPGATLRLRYLVEHASWSPSYNVRTPGDHKRITVGYYASVRQMSGEDWKNVSMTLSTATPSLAAEAPELAPITLALSRQSAMRQQAQGAGAAGQAVNRNRKMNYKQTKARIAQQKAQLEQQRGQQGKQPGGGGGSPGSNLFGVGGAQGEFRAPTAQAGAAKQYDRKLNKLGTKLQLLELQRAPEKRPGRRRANMERSNEAVSVTYRVGEKTTLPSRSDRQLIQIASLPMQGDFYELADPVLTPHVYREARARNTSDRVLLAGPVSAYRNGRFVGRGAIPTVAVGEPFTLGFGIDPSLRADRELIHKDRTVRGGNRVTTFRYRLSVQNFGSTKASVRLKDRIPTAGHDDQFSVELVDTSKDLSDADDYKHKERDKGILRWDISVPAGATGGDAASVTYKYNLAYDKQMTISDLPLRK